MGLTQEELDDINLAFSLFNIGGNKPDPFELRAGFSSTNVLRKDYMKKMDEICNSEYYQQKGGIELFELLEEFNAVVIAEPRELNEATFREYFDRVLDPDQETISYTSFRRIVLENLPQLAGDSVELRALFDSNASNGSELTFQEFCTACTSALGTQ